MSMSRLRPGFALARFLVVAMFAAATAGVPLAVSAQTAPAQAPKTPPAEAEKPAAQAALPSARSLVDRHVAAIGGRDAVLSHSSTRATGTFSVPSSGMSGALEVFAAKPDKSVVKINIPGVGDVLEGYDGKNAWTVSAMTGPMLLEGKQLEEKRFDTDFYGELHDDSRYQSMTTIEKTEFDGRSCYRIKLVRKNGGEDIEFYDVQTGLKAGRTATRETPMGTVTATTVETDYKKFGNLLQPTTVKNTVMGMQQVITISNVEYDNVVHSVFEPPAAVKALIK
jgi:hypothetical protein